MNQKKVHHLPATPDTVVWGYFDNSLEPVLTIKPGDIVNVEAFAHHAGDAPDLMLDAGVKAVYDAFPEDERGPGVHVVTGPIYIDGAKPGDILEVKVLDLKPRLKYGVNFSANWGMLFEEFDKKEWVTVFESDMKTASAKAVFSYSYPFYGDVPGRYIDPDSVERKPALENISVPLLPHLGIAAVAPKFSGKIDSIPPEAYGGNIDNRNFISGTSMLIPVQVEGALFVVGDPHHAQGDGEISGTGIEGHLDCTLELNLREDVKLSQNPILETETAWITHGFNEDLWLAMKEAGNEALDFLENNMSVTREDAYALLSVAGDFHVSQVVDGNKGVHCIIKKSLFAPGTR